MRTKRKLESFEIYRVKEHIVRVICIKYTGCNRRNGPDFGRVFLMLNYTEKNPKHLYPKFNGYGDIGQRKVWTSLVSAYCTLCDVILGVSGGWARATTIAFLRYR